MRRRGLCGSPRVPFPRRRPAVGLAAGAAGPAGASPSARGRRRSAQPGSGAGDSGDPGRMGSRRPACGSQPTSSRQGRSAPRRVRVYRGPRALVRRSRHPRSLEYGTDGRPVGAGCRRLAADTPCRRSGSGPAVRGRKAGHRGRACPPPARGCTPPPAAAQPRARAGPGRARRRCAIVRNGLARPASAGAAPLASCPSRCVKPLRGSDPARQGPPGPVLEGRRPPGQGRGGGGGRPGRESESRVQY